MFDVSAAASHGRTHLINYTEQKSKIKGVKDIKAALRRLL